MCCAFLDGINASIILLDDAGGTVHVGLQVGLVTNWVEVRVAHGLLSGKPLLSFGQHGDIRLDTIEAYLVIITQQLVEEVNSLVADEALIIGSDEAVPWLPLKSA